MMRIARPRESDWAPEEPDRLRAEAAREGYLFFRDLLPVEPVHALRTRVLEGCSALGWLDEAAPVERGMARPGVRVGAYDDDWTSLQARVQPLPEFRRLSGDPIIGAILATIFEGPARSGLGEACRVLSPGAPELTTRPHQDHFYVGGDTALWIVWIPLGDCPLQLGGLALLEQSHLTGLRPHRGEEDGRPGIDVAPDAVWVADDYRCGDVLMFNSLTVHRALHNRTSNRLRVSADFRFAPKRQGTGVGMS